MEDDVLKLKEVVSVTFDTTSIFIHAIVINRRKEDILSSSR